MSSSTICLSVKSLINFLCKDDAKIQKPFDNTAHFSYLCDLNSIFGMKISKNAYLKGFGICVIVLAIIRCVFPSVAKHDVAPETTTDSALTDSVAMPDSAQVARTADIVLPVRTVGKGSRDTVAVHPVMGVRSYKEAFPDSNDIQLSYAKKFGVEPVDDRASLNSLGKNSLVYIGGCPFYYVDLLKRSVPYLVPRASLLLYDIGRNFMDSLQIKGLPLHKVVVTSVLRSKDDLTQLSKSNRNVSENSCHQYGTTFDISYNRYKVVADPDGPEKAETRNDTLKFVLSEVLRDLREADRCLVKYEVKQGCFHITAK